MSGAKIIDNNLYHDIETELPSSNTQNPYPGLHRAFRHNVATEDRPGVEVLTWSTEYFSTRKLFNKNIILEVDYVTPAITAILSSFNNFTRPLPKPLH